MAFLSNKIGVGGLVTLRDGRLVLMQRSNHVAECQGLVDVPGGHAEPKEVGLGHELGGGESSDTIDDGSAGYYMPALEPVPTLEGVSNSNDQRTVQRLLSQLHKERAANLALRRQLLPELIGQEIFNSVVEEVRAEINIPPANLSAPKLLGVVHQLNSHGTPSFAFSMACDMDSEQVMARYRLGAEEKDESVALLLLLEDEISTAQEAGRIRLTPATQGCVELWRAQRAGGRCPKGAPNAPETTAHRGGAGFAAHAPADRGPGQWLYAASWAAPLTQ